MSFSLLLNKDIQGGGINLLDGLVSWWNCEEASGNLLDQHGSHDGTDTNTVTQAAGGKVGNARQFTNANLEYFAVAHHADFQVGADGISIAAWVYIDSYGSIKAIATKTNSIVGTTEWELEVTADNPAKVAFNGTGGGRSLSTDTFTTGTWVFVGGKGVGTVQSVWLNETEFVGGATSYTQATEGVKIGSGWALGSTTARMDGRMDEIAIWNRTLSDEEWAALYNSGSGLTYTNL